MCQISMVWLIICWVGSVKSQAMHKRVRGCRMLIASDSNALFLYGVSMNKMVEFCCFDCCSSSLRDWMRSVLSDGRYPLNVKFWPFAPDAIRASIILDGPINGRTSKPDWWASATKSAPGSATAGQPASLSSPMLRPSCKGRSSSGNFVRSVCSLSVCRLSSRMGVVISRCLRCARAVFSASTTKSVSPTICCCSWGNRQGVSGVPRGVGIR